MQVQGGEGVRRRGDRGTGPRPGMGLHDSQDGLGRGGPVGRPTWVGFAGIFSKYKSWVTKKTGQYKVVERSKTLESEDCEFSCEGKFRKGFAQWEWTDSGGMHSAEKDTPLVMRSLLQPLLACCGTVSVEGAGGLQRMVQRGHWSSSPSVWSFLILLFSVHRKCGKWKQYLGFVSIAATQKSLDDIQLKEIELWSLPCSLPASPQLPPEDEEARKRRGMAVVSRDCRAQGDDGSEDQEILAGGDLGRGLSVSSLSSQSQVRAAAGRDIGLLTSHSASSKPKRT
ncbi:hypothetical protein MJG53_015776 [Ovis ammon polii x Ovis aries]|uniref:Uncharacterized protein n=1 Tax=Ovis ammon polii x Ovis aries TaxID=2918886 RepID=A0ACB9UC64_9CETA|nr:hypothetical protein MJG53_015776 [Ovis ammon polii x Ovis aries]